VTAPVQRSSVEGVLANHEKRVGILEATPGSHGGEFDIKLVSDADFIDPGTWNDFYFNIPPDLNGTRLLMARIFVSVASGNYTYLLVQNAGNDCSAAVDLVTNFYLEDANFYSDVANPTYENVTVADGDFVRIVLDSADGDGKGLGVILGFG